MLKILKLSFAILTSTVSLGAISASITATEGGDYPFPIIQIEGEFVDTDGDKFSLVANQYPVAVVNLSSPGGSLLSGIQIGTLIKLKGFSTVIRNGNTCASAGAYAWLAGSQRYAEPESKIGFHAAYRMKQGVASESGAGNALLGSYLSKIGLSDSAIVYLTSAPPEQMTWLGGKVAQKLGINVQDFSSVRKRNAPAVNQQAALPPVLKSPTSIKPAEASVDFVKKYFSYWSSDGEQAVKYLSDVFDDNVMFYGTQKAKNLIIKEKASMIRRWPARAYIERPSSLSVSCEQLTSICTIEGLLDWEVRNEARNAKASGVSSFKFTLDFSRNLVKVVGEDGSVIERKKQ